MSKAWMPMYWGDYYADTGHLRTIEHGAYLLLIGHYWCNGSLPNDDYRLAAITRMRVEDWRRIRPAIQRFFSDGWVHHRIESELSRSAELSNKRKVAALQKHSKSSAKPEHLHTQSQSQSQSHTEETKVSSVVRLRGTRIDANWDLSSEDRAFAAERGLGLFETDNEAGKFRDYWASKPGKSGIKLDWKATWRNWVRKTCEDRGIVKPQPAAEFRPPPGAPSNEELMRRYSNGADRGKA